MRFSLTIYKDLIDLELMTRIAKYESRALEELYDRYSSILYSLIKKISPDEKTAEIILIEVFVIVWRKIEFFDFKAGNVYTWLIYLARNRAIDSLRRTRRVAGEIDFYEDKYENYFIIPLLDKDIDSLDLNTALSIKPKIENALDKLTDSQKYILHLAFYEGYTLVEISDLLKIPVESVREKVLTASGSLRDNLLGR